MRLGRRSSGYGGPEALHWRAVAGATSIRQWHRNGSPVPPATGCWFGEPGGGQDCKAQMCSEIRGIHYDCCANPTQQGYANYEECYNAGVGWFKRKHDCGDRVNWDNLRLCCLPYFGDCSKSKTDPVEPFEKAKECLALVGQ
jgi:hypothetical protein